MDSWNRQDAAAEQSRSLIQCIPVKDGTLKSRVIPGWYIFLENTGFCRTEQFLENTGCCRAEQFLDRRDSWKIRDAAEQSSSWIERYLEKTGCCRAERFLDRKIPGKDRMLQSRAVHG